MTPRNWAATLTAVIAGCGGPGTVSGVVTYDGKPVGGGVVVLAPLENGSGMPPTGVIDSGGRYTVTDVPPGRVRVQVAGPRPFRFPSEATDRLPPAVPEFPDESAGNNQEFEVRSGSQTLDIPLLPPPAKR